MPASIKQEPNDIYRLTISGTLQKLELEGAQNILATGINAGAHPSILVVLENFEGFEPGETWGELDFLYSHVNDIEKIAIVGAPRWEENALAFAGAGYRKSPVRFFPPEKIDDALAWRSLERTVGSSTREERKDLPTRNVLKGSLENCQKMVPFGQSANCRTCPIRRTYCDQPRSPRGASGYPGKPLTLYCTGAINRDVRAASLNQKERLVKSAAAARVLRAKSAANISSTDRTVFVSLKSSVISKFRRKLRLSKFAVPTPA
jgi:hypothetical protein